MSPSDGVTETRGEETGGATEGFMSGKDKDASSKLPESEVDAQIEAMLKDLGLPDEAKAHTSRTAISASLPVLPDAHSVRRRPTVAMRYVADRVQARLRALPISQKRAMLRDYEAKKGEHTAPTATAADAHDVIGPPEPPPAATGSPRRAIFLAPLCTAPTWSLSGSCDAGAIELDEFEAVVAAATAEAEAESGMTSAVQASPSSAMCRLTLDVTKECGPRAA